MSLINRMLQDLEARSSDGVGASAIHGQVRAVPERRQTRVGWWLVLGVIATILVAALVLLWLRRSEPIAPAPAPIARPQFSLKLAADLSMVPLPAMADPVPKNAVPVAAAPDAPAPSDNARKTAGATIVDSQSSRVAGAASVAKPVATGSQPATMPVAVPPVIPAPAKVNPPAATPGMTDSGTSVLISKQVKDLSPQQRAENEFRKAATLIQQGRAADAIDILEQALLLDPQHNAARQTLIGVLLESKRHGDAVRRLREGLNLDPNQPGLAMILARQLVDKGELQAAVDTLRSTLPYALERADYQAFLAALLQRQAKHKEAIEHYLSAVRMAPQSGVWWMGLGISLQAENRPADAQDAFNRAKATNSLSAELLAFVEQRLRLVQH